MSSASSSTRWIEAIVASMLTTTPFLRPRDGCVPMPITLSSPSGPISPTIATIFDVPMSSPTIRFLLSFTMHASFAALCWSSRRLGAFLAESRNARREPVAIAQVHGVDLRARARQRAERPAMRGDEAGQARLRLVASQVHRQRPGRAHGLELPSAARRQAHLLQRERQRPQLLRPRLVARGDFRRAAFRPLEYREIGGDLGGEHLAARADQRRI